MPRGIAICMGLNRVDPNHYQGWSGDLNACEADANDMASLAQKAGFSVRKLLTTEATRANFKSTVGQAAATASPGDIVLISYSGHGGQLPDLNSDEPDGKDETWCLFDGQLVDDETYVLLSQFRQGVRILVFADSCHSGTSTKELLLSMPISVSAQIFVSDDSRAAVPIKYRAMPAQVGVRTYAANKDFYDAILMDPANIRDNNEIRANCILISGCQDNQLSADGPENGRFTGRLKAVWNNGSYKGDYESFHKTIRSEMPIDQTPNLFSLGPNPKDFISQQPFRIQSVGGTMKIVDGDQPFDLHGKRVVLDFKELKCTDADDLSKMVDAIKPIICDALFKASQTGREWTVSGSVSTTSGGTTATAGGSYTGGRDWSGSVTASTPISGGVSGSVTVTTGSSGTSGSIGIGGTW